MTTREYEKSHPWLKFVLDLSHAAPPFWMLLGEARSKCDHIRFVPLSVETAYRLNKVYFAKGLNATTAIEGNSLSEAQVQERIEGQLELPISKEYLGIEIDNMVGAYNGIIAAVHRGEHISVNVETLCRLNKQILAGLDVPAYVVPGELRKCSVAAGNYLAPPWQDVPYLIGRLCEWLETFEASARQDRIPYAFIKAVVAHVYLEWIHPFGDGNGRLGRLVEFLILISSGIPQPAAHVLTSHYNDTRSEYYRQLNVASGNGGDLRPFLRYAAQGFVDGLTEAIKHLHRQQEELMWRALVDEAFIGKHTPAANRQRLLAIELAKGDQWVSRSVVRKLTPSLVEAYAQRTAKTLSRDINRLMELGFLQSRPDKRVRVRIELVRGMRPFIATPADAS